MLEPPPSPDEIRTRVLVDVWPADQTFTRAHSHAFGSIQFDSRTDADSRFSTVRTAQDVVPIIYAGEDPAAAASESIFHTVDTPAGNHRPRRVWVSKYLTWHWSTVRTTRALRLVRLAGTGLDAFGVSRADLIEGGRSTYPDTRRWATALLEALPDIDGFWWESRQAPTKRALAIFAPTPHRLAGVASGDLHPDGPVLPFATPAGLDLLDAIANELDVTVVRP